MLHHLTVLKGKVVITNNIKWHKVTFFFCAVYIALCFMKKKTTNKQKTWKKKMWFHNFSLFYLYISFISVVHLLSVSQVWQLDPLDNTFGTA